MARQLPGDDEFLLVAAGEALDRRVNAVCPHVELLDQRLSVAFDRADIEQAERRERRPVVALQNRVLGQRQLAAPRRSRRNPQEYARSVFD